MLTPDFINGFFEFFGAFSTWLSIKNLYHDKGYAGVSAPAVIFFLSWGLWNLFYYPHLNQMWSFAGGAVMVATNVVWISLMMYYGRKK